MLGYILFKTKILNLLLREVGWWLWSREGEREREREKERERGRGEGEGGRVCVSRSHILVLRLPDGKLRRLGKNISHPEKLAEMVSDRGQNYQVCLSLCFSKRPRFGQKPAASPAFFSQALVFRQAPQTGAGRCVHCTGEADSFKALYGLHFIYARS